MTRVGSTKAQGKDPDEDYPEPLVHIDDNESESDLLAGIYAGLAKFLARFTFSLTTMSKGLLKWWFRYPIKLFRPHAVNPWYVLSARAERDGTKVSMRYVRSVFSDEGMHFFGKNMVPLMVANSIVGAVLFNTYGHVLDRLKDQDEEFLFYQPFLSGAVAGGAQSVLGIPLENIQKHIPVADLVERKDVGMIRATYDAVKKALSHHSGYWHRTKFLYRGGVISTIRDSIGFMAFFGVFESARHIGKGSVAVLWGVGDAHNYPIFEKIIRKTGLWKENKSGVDEESHYEHSSSLAVANACAVIAAGAFAGVAYQLVCYPLDKLKPILLHEFYHKKQQLPSRLTNRLKSRWRGTQRVIRQHGIRRFYKGIRGQLVRSMPPSALGLLAYEIARSQFWDGE